MKKTSIAHIRREYLNEDLVEKKTPKNPLILFQKWFNEALKAEVIDVTAMALATVSKPGIPSNRIVLLKGLDQRGFVFFTNFQSQKGRELTGRPVASLLFFWPQLVRQVRIDGKVVKVSAKESDAYFKTRPRGSQLGAWASEQSETVPSRDFLEKSMKALEAKYQGKAISRPPHWGGFLVIPRSIEFWQGRPNRLHDRLRYVRQGQSWRRERLAP
ncbi:MAG TPA: pyridoxamine 5'-phosphate oxidase [bacterium]|jgi:pyridoxamine 5'-phosphate oxidase|nr:pyridoxamine 5'-phosphate oxidase [bacterium]